MNYTIYILFGLGLFFGLAIAFVAFAWMIAANAHSIKMDGGQRATARTIAVYLGMAASIFWVISVAVFVHDGTGQPLLKTNTTAISAPGTAPPLPSSICCNVPKLDKPENPSLPWLALVGLVLSMVTGAYLTSLQHARKAGQDIVEELKDQRQQFEDELVALKSIKRKRTELAGGLVAALIKIAGSLDEAIAQLKNGHAPDSLETADWGRIAEKLRTTMEELGGIEMVNRLLDALIRKDLQSANSEAGQLADFLKSNKIDKLLTMSLQPLQDILEELKIESPDTFSNTSRYSRIAEILDEVNAIA